MSRLAELLSIAASTLAITAFGQPPVERLPSAETITNPTLPAPVVPMVPALASSPSTPADKLACPTTCSVPEFDWKKVPRVRGFPRPGNFPVPPTGPGYYSFVQQLRGECIQAPPKYPYPRFGLIQPSFFDVDNFSYLDDPKNTELDFFDPLKRVRFGDNWLFVTGGDIRNRYENHYNARLTQTNNDFDLTRLRVYGDWWYQDDFRFYAEFIGAYSTPQNLPYLPIDRNDADFLNLFVDLKLTEWGGDPAYLRVGRQELLFGSQRMISPLEWANTRRAFQGVRGFRQTEKWDFDLFWAQPVIPNVDRLDSVDNNQNFVGAWSTYRPKKGQSIDTYYLFRDITGAARVLGIPLGDTTRHTFGGRYAGNENEFLFDFEAAIGNRHSKGKQLQHSKGKRAVHSGLDDTRVSFSNRRKGCSRWTSMPRFGTLDATVSQSVKSLSNSAILPKPF